MGPKVTLPSSGDLYRSRLDQILDQRHELFRLAGLIDWDHFTHREGEEPKPMMHEPEKSDLAIGATKPANKAGTPVAERAEPRAGTEGNTGHPRTPRTQSRASVSPGLDRVRHAARQRKKEK